MFQNKSAQFQATVCSNQIFHSRPELGNDCLGFVIACFQDNSISAQVLTFIFLPPHGFLALLPAKRRPKFYNSALFFLRKTFLYQKLRKEGLKNRVISDGGGFYRFLVGDTVALLRVGPHSEKTTVKSRKAGHFRTLLSGCSSNNHFPDNYTFLSFPPSANLVTSSPSF